MARKVITTTTQRDDDDDDGRERAKHELETDPGELGYVAVMSSFKNTHGCKVRVHRLTPEGKQQYCFMGPPEDFQSEEAIRLFHARQPYAREEGNYVLSVEVNGEPRNSFPVYIAPQISAPGLDSINQGNGGMADYVRELREQNRILLERMTHREQTPMMEMIQGISQLDQMRGEKQLPLDSLLKAVEIGTRLNGGGGTGGGDDWMGMIRDLVKEAAPTLVPALAGLAARLMTPAKAPVEQPPQQVAEGTDVMTPEKEEALLAQYSRDAIAYLKKKAMTGSHPQLYIEMIIDNQEEPLYGRLIHKILNEDFSAFASIDPEIEKPQYAGFFRSIYDGIRSAFIPKNTVAHDFGGKNGNGPDSSGNGTTGKKRSH